MTAAKKTDIVFDIARDDLVNLLSDAALFAGRDDTLSILCAIHLRMDTQGLLTATASDRFVAGRASATVDATFARETDLLLHASEARRIARLHPEWGNKYLPAEPLHVTLTGRDGVKEPGMLRIESVNSDGRVISEHRGMEVDVLTVVDQILANDVAGGPVPHLSPARLGVFGRLHNAKGTPMTLGGFGPTKPVMVTVGDTFRGAIMPMR